MDQNNMFFCTYIDEKCIEPNFITQCDNPMLKQEYLHYYDKILKQYNICGLNKKKHHKSASTMKNQNIKNTLQNNPIMNTNTLQNVFNQINQTNNNDIFNETAQFTNNDSGIFMPLIDKMNNNNDIQNETAQFNNNDSGIFMPLIDDTLTNNDAYINENIGTDYIHLSQNIENDTLGLQPDLYNKYTLINKNEYVPNIDNAFDEWLYFSKKIWKRQQKYKKNVIFQKKYRKDNKND